MSGTFTQDHFQPFKPTLHGKRFTSLIFIMGSHFLLLSQEANNGKCVILPTSKLNEGGFSVPGALKLGHLQPINPLLFPNFCNFYIFILGAISYYARGPIMGKGNSSNFKTKCNKGFSVPRAFKLGHLHPIKPLLIPNFCNFCTFILGSHFLLSQRANNGIRELFQLQN